MKKEFLQILNKLISFETTSDKKEEINKCFSYIKEYFSSYDGIVVDEFEKEDTKSVTINFKKHLKPKIILLAHIDVVPARKEMFHMTRKDTKVYGRGVSDMKGMVALGMILMQEYSKLAKRPSFGLVITSDEERGGFDGTGYLVENKLLSPKVVIAPDGGDNFKITYIEKGIIHLKMIVSGVSAHGSQPWLGSNALECLIDNYQKIRSLFNQQNQEGWYKTINLGKIEGGDAANKVPDLAEALLDIRYTQKDDPQKIIKDIKKIMDKNVDIEVLLNEPLCFTPKNDRYLISFKRIIEKTLSKKISFACEHGGSDARFFSRIKIPIIIVKPQAGGQHADSEWLDIESSIIFFEILNKFIIDNQ